MKVVYITDTVSLVTGNVTSTDIVLQCRVLHMKGSRIGFILGTEASTLMWYG
jgi:hypothetical protein